MNRFDFDSADDRDAVGYRFSGEGEGFYYALMGYYGAEYFTGSPLETPMREARDAIEAAVEALRQYTDYNKYQDF